MAQALKAFGALKKAVFLDKNLSLKTKRKICVLSVLLYGGECWVLLRKQEKTLNTFHHRCIRSILGISNRQQWSECISMAEVRRRWGDEETAADKVKKRRLEWLGHIARMPDHRVPNFTLFSWLPEPRLRCGPKKRWRDMLRRDLKDIGVSEKSWFDEAVRSKTGWRALCRDCVSNCRESEKVRAPIVTTRVVVCEVCKIE